MPKQRGRYETEESEDDYEIVDSGEEEVSPWHNGNESEPDEQPKVVPSTSKESTSNSSSRRRSSSTNGNSKPPESPYKVESGLPLSPKNDKDPIEPLFSSGSKKQALRFHQVLTAYKNSGEASHKRRGSTGGMVVKDQEEMMDDLQKLRKNVGELSNERVQLKTKILRMESELQKKDRQIEDILGAKANISGNGNYGKLLSETTLISNLKRQIKSLEKDISRRDEELLKLRNKMKGTKSAQLEQQLAEVTAQKLQLESILENNRREIDREYSDTVKALEEVNDRMKNKLQKYRAVNKKRTTLVQQLQQTNNSLEERKSELLEENANLQSKLQEIQFQSNLKITELNERNTFLEEESARKALGSTKEVAALNEIIEKMRVDHKEQMEKLHQEHMEQLEKLRTDHAAQLAELEESRKQEAARYQAELESLAISPNADAAAHAKPISKYHGNENLAATKIQAAYKGHRVRKQNKINKENKEIKEKEEKEKPVPPPDAEVPPPQPTIEITPDEDSLLRAAAPPQEEVSKHDEENAAIAIQKIFKGRRAREDFKKKKASAKAIKEELDEKKIRAVVKIQKVFRGYMVRKQYKKRKLSAASKKTGLTIPSELQKLIGGEISPRSRFELGGFLGRPDYSKMIVESEPQFVLA